MAYTRLTGEEWTPLRLALTVGDTCTTDGLNDMQKFCAWMRANDGSLSSTGLLYDQQEALGYAGRGWMVFGSMTGQLHEGGRAYGGPHRAHMRMGRRHGRHPRPRRGTSESEHRRVRPRLVGVLRRYRE